MIIKWIDIRDTVWVVVWNGMGRLRTGTSTDSYADGNKTYRFIKTQGFVD
jgi:hypothetical protein